MLLVSSNDPSMRDRVAIQWSRYWLAWSARKSRGPVSHSASSSAARYLSHIAMASAAKCARSITGARRKLDWPRRRPCAAEAVTAARRLPWEIWSGRCGGGSHLASMSPSTLPFLIRGLSLPPPAAAHRGSSLIRLAALPHRLASTASQSITTTGPPPPHPPPLLWPPAIEAPTPTTLNPNPAIASTTTPASNDLAAGRFPPPPTPLASDDELRRRIPMRALSGRQTPRTLVALRPPRRHGACAGDVGAQAAGGGGARQAEAAVRCRCGRWRSRWACSAGDGFSGSLVLWQRKKNRWKRLLLFTFWFSQSVENRGIIVRSLGLKREKKRKRWKLRKRKC
uniref:Uncharacterized protein n=1 Tax=Setaria viridis TaxID=4556 RepID=A0A4U6V8X2_SETVI|nr:hypothetical protein SEVIR_3G138100v2 [Setaria viridis]